MFIAPTPLPPKHTVEHHVQQRDQPAQGCTGCCILLTVPVVKDVVTVVNSADWATPKRASLPSMLPMGLAETGFRQRRLPWDSAQKQKPQAHGK